MENNRFRCDAGPLNKAGYTARYQWRGLGRGSNVVGRGIGGSRIHDSIKYMRLGRSGNVKTACKIEKKRVTYGHTDKRTDGHALL